MSKKKESNKKESQDKKSQDDKTQDPESQDKKSQDDKTQDPESQKTETTEETFMSRTVTVKKDDDSPENVFNLGESLKQDQKYHLAKGGDGLHFKNLESVKRYFERRYKGHQVKID